MITYLGACKPKEIETNGYLRSDPSRAHLEVDGHTEHLEIVQVAHSGEYLRISHAESTGTVVQRTVGLA